MIESSRKLNSVSKFTSTKCTCLSTSRFNNECCTSHKKKNYFVNGKPILSRRNFECSLACVRNFIVTWSQWGFTTSVCGTSGKIVCSRIQKEKFPSWSKLLHEIPRKSRTRGSTIAMSFSRKSYICSPRSVTIIPTGIPSRSLKFEIDFREWVTRGNWPVISARSFFREEKSLFPDATYVPIPIFITTFSIRGVCMVLVSLSEDSRFGRMSVKKCVRNDIK